MIRRPVSSSNIASVGWQPDGGTQNEGTLEVEFHSGHVYRYDAVPEDVYEALLGASSVGRFLNYSVIGQYDERRVK